MLVVGLIAQGPTISTSDAQAQSLQPVAARTSLLQALAVVLGPWAAGGR